jgi:rod shape-determining protein MreD
MRGFTQILAALLVLLLQMTLVNRLTIGGIRPDLVLLLLIFLVVRRNAVAAVAIGFLLGFLQDLGNPDFLGLNALAGSLTAYAVSKVSTRMAQDHALFQGLLIFCGVLFHDLIYLPFFHRLDLAGIVVEFFRYSVPGALYTALLGYPVLLLAWLLSGRRSQLARGS